MSVKKAQPQRPSFPEEVPNEALQDPQAFFDRPEITHDLTENALKVMKKRYLVKNDQGEPIETPEEMFWRVATHIALQDFRYGATVEEVQEVAEKFYEMMINRYWEPNSPTLMNAGARLGQLSACFVLPIEDELYNGEDGIYDTLSSMARIHQSGGGTGFAWTRLRPRGARVHSTKGISSGPVSFMEVYDASTEAVKQGGTRRGANMGVLRVDHPDIEEFIQCKRDTDKITNFNISVGITAEFMEAVKAGEEYELRDPRDDRVVETRDAREIFDLIIEHAWATGEPGIFFIDEANKYNPVPHIGEYEATNPCVVGATRLATDRGLLTMEELERDTMEIRVATDDRVPELRRLVGRPTPLATPSSENEEATGGAAPQTRVGQKVREKVRVDNLEQHHGVTARYAEPVSRTRENTEVFRLVTEHGYEITATPDHEFYTPEGPVELQDLEVGQEILLQSGEGVWSQDYSFPDFEPTDKYKARVERGEAHPPEEWSRELGQMLGWIVGDGWVSEETPEGRNVPNYSVGLIFGDNERELEPEFRRRIQHWTGLQGNRTERKGRIQLIYRSSFYYLLDSLGLVTDDGKSGRVPDSLWRAPREAVVGFLQALFTADGTVNRVDSASYCSVRLASSERELLREVQTLLANLGIVARLYHRREAGEKEMPDGQGGTQKYAYRDQHELILGGANRDRFIQEIGFLTSDKQEKAESFIDDMPEGAYPETFMTRVESIEPAGQEDVYCTTEPSTHSIVVNGLATANCGEQPLLPWDVCNLGSLNVGRFVDKEADPDLPWRERVDWEELKYYTRLSSHFLDNVIDANNFPLEQIDRRALQIRRIGNGIMGWADMLVRLQVPYDSEEGVEIARELQRIITEEEEAMSERLAQQRGVFPEWEESIWGPDETCARDENGKRIKPEQPVRNCNMNTVAPTGTISIFAGCSGGIEPLYAVAFMRNQAGELMPDVNDDFVEMAKEEGWYSEELMEKIADEGTIHMEEVPDHAQEIFRTAHDVSPEWHTRMQAAFQEHVHAAISKTVNFPEEATQKDVRQIYELAYELGCKGVTVYRDASRESQVLSTGDKTVDEVGKDYLDEKLVELERELEKTQEELEEQLELKEKFKREARQSARRVKRSRPEKLMGPTYEIESPLGTMFITINQDEDGDPFEIFVYLGKAGGPAMADAEGLGRLISLALRSGIPLKEIHKQLRGISSHRVVGFGPHKVHSTPDAIAQVIEWYLEEKEGIQQELPISEGAASPAQKSGGQTGGGGQPESRQLNIGQLRQREEAEEFLGACPDCGASLQFQEGCAKCPACGYSECG